MWKDFLYFSRTERQGIIILAVLIILVGTASWFIPPREVVKIEDNQKFEEEYAIFMTSLKEKEQEKEVSSKKYQHEKREVILASFDPNTADSITFLNLGLPSWMAKNILKYRAKGGRFRKQSDFQKVYGLTEKQYTTLEPYISIADIPKEQDTIRLFSHQEPRDTLQYYKYPSGTTISLNQADTTELKKIPGIGSAIARMIVGYRKKLGGFYQVEQLQDIQIYTLGLILVNK